ncbi:hypothetical protein ACWGIA_39305 [Streptomyces bobili]
MTDTLTRTAYDKEDTLVSQLKTRDLRSGSPRRSDTPDALPVSRATRRVNKEKTRRKFAKAGIVVSMGAVAFSIATTCSLVVTWGLKEAALFQVGAVLTTAYAAVNDIRKSVVDGTAWRSRHVVISWLMRRHPLD